MKQFLTLYFTLLCGLQFGFAQTQPQYFELVTAGYDHYKSKEYEKAALYYSQAADIKGYNNGTSNDFMVAYNAACSWSLAGNNDKAFALLDKLAGKINFITFYDLMLKDTDFENLRKDSRWQMVCNKVKHTKEEFESHLNKNVVKVLDTIYDNDQKDRLKALDYEKQFGGQSAEAKSQWAIVAHNDAENLDKISVIVNKYGWLGPTEVGFKGNQTLFLVVQHADLATQLKYLPIIAEAVKAGKALPKDYAYLTDRVALRQGNKQIYGSQLTRDGKTGKMLYPSPLDNPDNVDKRRAEVGLGSMAEYLKENGLEWDAAKYKIMLEEQETKKKANNNK